MLPEIPKEFLQKLQKADIKGTYKLELWGEDNAMWFFRFDDGLQILQTLGPNQYPDVIVRVDRIDLKALLEGRMSVSDGLVSERLSLVGDISKIAQLKTFLFA